MILESGRALQSATRTADKRNGGQAYTLDKMFGFVLIHHFTAVRWTKSSA